MKVLSSPLGDAQLDVLTTSGPVAVSPIDIGPTPSPAFARRIDHSVNNARVDEIYTATPVLRANSAGNAAGGYNGGGVGNKCILGIDVGSVPLASLVSIEYTFIDLNFGVEPSGSPPLPYLNLVLDMNGDGSAFKLASIDPSFGPPSLANCTVVTNLDGSKTVTFNASTNNLLVVNGVPVPPLPPGGPGFVPPTQTTNPVPPFGLPGAWQSASYSIAAILAAYPAARLHLGATGDGGMPKSPNVTLALMVILGDSTNQIEQAWLLSDVRFNGSQV
jgi:hypothetical protein